MKTTPVFVLLLLCLAGTATADPFINTSVEGSSFIVHATNPEERAYNCHISYTLDYETSGEHKSQTYNADFSVAAKANDVVVLRQSTNWPASTLKATAINHSCN